MTTSDCPWASIVPRHKDHEDSESACYARNTVAIRSHFRPRISTIEEAYDASGHLRSEFLETDFERVILPRYHRRAAEAVLMGMNGRVRLTSGLRQAIRTPLTYNQLAHRHPWAVIVVRRGRRYRKLCANIATAVHTAALLEEKYGNATVVSR